MRHLLNRYWIVITIMIAFDFVQCTNDGSGTNNIYNAEKMFFEAEKIKKNILINPDIANPEEYEKADNAYQKIIEIFNQNNKVREIKTIVGRSWLARAELLLLQKKYDDAINVYQKIIQRSDSDKELSAVAQYSIASSLQKLQRFDAAIDAYQRVVRNYQPVLSDTLLPNMNILQIPIYIARLYRQQQKNHLVDQQYADARAYYQRICQQYPRSMISLAAENQIAVSFGDQGQWEQAVEMLNGMILKYQNMPELFNVMFTLGNIYHLQLHQPEKALDVFHRIIQKYPHDKNLGQVYLGIGGIYLAQKYYDKARDAFQSVLNNYRNDRNSCLQAQISIARTHELENNWNKALNEYNWAVENYPNTLASLEIPLYIAAYYQKGQQRDLARAAFENAIKQYQQVMDRNPETVLATIALDYIAACYTGLEKWQEASETLQSLTKQELPGPKLVDTYLKLGTIYEEKLNEKEKAFEVYSTLLQKYPQLPNAQSLNEKTAKLQQDISQYQQGNQSPRPSEIISTVIISPSEIKINWQSNQERDFDHYKLVRSSSPGVDLTDASVASINRQQQTEYIDENLTCGKTYFYRLYTFDKGGLHSASQEVTVKLEEKQIQATINLTAQSDAWYKVSLSWNPYLAKDFDSYKIYRSTTPIVTFASKLVRSIFDQSITRLEDIDLKENTTYYYKAYLYNRDGSNKSSNEIKVTTLKNLPPAFVTLNKPLTLNNTTVELSWAPSRDDDFSVYRIYRSENLPISLNSPPIWMSSNREITKYKDTGLNFGKDYYYKIVVYDKGGLFAESNQVAVKW